VQINAGQRIELTGAFGDTQADYVSAYPDVRVLASNTRLSTLGAAWSARWTPQYSTRLALGQSRHRYDDPANFYLTETTLNNVLLQNAWRQGNHLLTAALERREDRLSNDPIDQSRHQDGVALGYGYHGGPHTLQVNLRHDRDSQFGGQGTGGIAYGYAFAPGWRATAAAGTAFRVPTLYQRFSEYGDAALQPEKSRNIELGLRWSRGASRLDVTAYRNRVSHLIDYVAGAGACVSPYGCYENVSEASLQGVTLAGAHRLAGVNWGAALDLQNPQNTATGKLLARRARRVFKLNADTRLSDWNVGAEWQAASRRYDDAANASALAGYGIVNLYASATLARQWQLLARIDNALARDYELASGYAMGGRKVYVGLRWTPVR
jgi:vitamin B12 transporter